MAHSLRQSFVQTVDMKIDHAARGYKIRISEINNGFHENKNFYCVFATFVGVTFENSGNDFWQKYVDAIFDKGWENSGFASKSPVLCENPGLVLECRKTPVFLYFCELFRYLRPPIIFPVFCFTPFVPMGVSPWVQKVWSENFEAIAEKFSLV